MNDLVIGLLSSTGQCNHYAGERNPTGKRADELRLHTVGLVVAIRRLVAGAGPARMASNISPVTRNVDRGRPPRVISSVSASRFLKCSRRV